MKIQMNLDDFKGDYAMSCSTHHKSKMFCNFLHKQGRKMRSGSSYKEFDHWIFLKTETVYFFNVGCVGSIEEAKKNGYKILDIKEFIVN